MAALWPRLTPHPLAAKLTRQDAHDRALLSWAEGSVAQLLQGLQHFSWRLCRHRGWSGWPRVTPPLRKG